MRKMLWVLCGFAVAAPLQAAPDAGCMKSRDLVLKAATERECPEEEAEAKAMTCEAAVKDSKRLYDLIKSCHAKPKKGGASSSSGTKPGIDMKSSGSVETIEVPPGKHQCRAADAADHKVFAANGSDESSLECLKGLKEMVAKKRCEAGAKEFKFLYQTPRSGGKWSDGIDSSARCK